MKDYVATYVSTLSDRQMISLTLALRHSLEHYVAQDDHPQERIQSAPADSHIGTCRDLLRDVEAIRLGNRRGGHNPFDIKMVAQIVGSETRFIQEIK